MKIKKTAIIFGVSGQDGAYLSNFLINKNYKVIGITRNKKINNLFRLKKLKILDRIFILKGDALDKKFCKKIISYKIDEIYYLSGYSSVTGSFIDPETSFKSNLIGLLNILQIIKNNKLETKLFNAGSGQFYGDNKSISYNINSKIDPNSPYGISKAASYWLVKIYREKYNIFCCTGVLFNHESSLRSSEFVTKKIVDTALKIKKNKKIKLRLGNIDMFRDWGWAPEYVEAMWLMLQASKPEDLIIGSGKLHSIREFVNEVFKQLNLNKKNLITGDKKLKRNLDIKSYKANIIDTKKKINWTPKIKFKEIISKMINNELF